MEALKDFNHQYEGVPTQAERMQLEYQKLLADDPALEERLAALPGRVFSGKEHPKVGSKAVFFCFALPGAEQGAEPRWTEEAGRAAWYLYDLATGDVLEDPAKIVDVIRCSPETPRHCSVAKETLSEVRAKVERHIKNTYLKSVQAPAGVKPALKAWMELS